ncbi:MAG: PAS domain S-box protein [Chitinophagales bacterium]|nr:PAS domain S-box protein [Chitinophagales bacterium]
MFLFGENKTEVTSECFADLVSELNAVLKTAGVATMLLNKDFEVQFFSEGIHNLYNISIKDIGKKIKDIPGYFAGCDITFYAEKIIENSIGFKGKVTTGRGKHYMKRMIPFSSKNKTLNGIIVTFTDITDLVNTQMALELSENRFRDMAEVAVDYFFELSVDGTIVYVSPSMKESLGYSKEDVLGRNISEFIPQNELLYVVQHSFKHTKGKNSYPAITHHVIKKDGSLIVVEARGKAIRNDKDEVIGFRAINRNITDRISNEKEQEYLNKTLERKVAERTSELAEKQRQLVAAQKIGRVGSWVWNLEKDTVDWSDMIFEIFDIDKSSAVSFENFKERIHKSDIDYVLSTEQKAMSNKNVNSFQTEYRIKHRNGNEFFIDATVHIYRNKEGRAIKLIGAAQDITPLKLQEEERQKFINELMQTNKELQQFNYIVSHNLRSSVTNLIGLSNIYQKGIGDKRNDKIVENILESAQNLDGVIKDLNQILQIRSNASHKKEKVELDEVLNSVVKSLDLQIQQANAKIVIEYNSIKKILAIKSYLSSIFYNLISNAIKYRNTENSCEIKVIVDEFGKFTRIVVGDNGLGFDAENNKDAIFALYKRFHPRIEGKGIGLYLVKVQVETLGGSVEVESRVGEGTKFTVYLPLTD